MQLQLDFLKLVSTGLRVFYWVFDLEFSPLEIGWGWFASAAIGLVILIKRFLLGGSKL